MKHLIATTICLLVLFVGLALINGSGDAETPYRYEPAIVTLAGTLVLEKHYGPPNFGESPDTDSVVIVPVLKLDIPISVAGNRTGDVDQKSFSGLTRIQLVGLKSLNLIKSERHIVVEGSLFQKQSPEHFTDVLMQVDKVN